MLETFCENPDCFNRLARNQTKFCSRQCNGEANRGLAKGDRQSESKSGYIRIRQPDGSRVYLHRFLMAQKIGRELSEAEVVHHIDENKRNNRIENLMLFENQAKHLEYHRANPAAPVADADTGENEFDYWIQAARRRRQTFGGNYL